MPAGINGSAINGNTGNNGNNGHNGNSITVTPSIKGLATIWDKDILIYAVSQLVAQRSDFASAAVPGGAGRLADKINAKSDSLLRD